MRAIDAVPGHKYTLNGEPVKRIAGVLDNGMIRLVSAVSFFGVTVPGWSDVSADTELECA